MNRIFNPPHRGDTLRDDVLPALGLTVTEAASQLGVTRAALSRILHGHAGISPEMALRLEAWLGEENGGRADVWLAQQSAHDLWRAREGRAEGGEGAGARVTARLRTSSGGVSTGSARRPGAS